LIILLLIKVR